MIQLFLSHSKSIKSDIVIPFMNDLSLLDFSYWFDRTVISSGEDIYTCIIDGIKMSSHCVAFIDNTSLYLNPTRCLISNGIVILPRLPRIRSIFVIS